MTNFVLPKWVKEHCIQYSGLHDLPDTFMEQLKINLKKFNVENPIVSIVIPAYNEEKDIIRTLSSLTKIKTNYSTELIVANNNSTDKTQEILDKLEVKSVFVKPQGVSFARQYGMEMAKGKYILSADSDSIYPPTWVDAYVKALENPNISCAYGEYSFIPSNNARITLALYEILSRTFFKIKKQNRECVNVLGLNSGFKKEDAMKLGGYHLNLKRCEDGKCEDGMMALTLMQAGNLHLIKGEPATIWTSDRRLMADGNLSTAMKRRIKKELLRISIYTKPSLK